MNISNRVLVKLFLVISVVGLCFTSIESHAAGKWDGRYSSKFKFKMGASSVCPKSLPIEVVINVTDNVVSGFIFNNGGKNSHDFCSLYHNGDITGKVAEDGIVKLKVKQKDSHSREYSSYKIKGDIEGTLKLYSWSNEYHPTHKFTLTKIVETEPATPVENIVISEKKTVQLQTKELTPVIKSTQATKNTDALISPLPHKKWEQASNIEEAKAHVNEIQASITMFVSIKKVLNQQPITMKERVLSVVDVEIDRLRAEKIQLEKVLSARFSTPIRPENSNLGVSAFRAADTFPKIPFYVPGTAETGEMIIIPRVSDDGYLMYQFDFLDLTSVHDKVRDTISIKHEDIDNLIGGLQKIDSWTVVSQKNNVNRRISKSSACIPKGNCENKKQGISSTEVVFQVYEDGSTAGRIQRNKGRFSVGYNMSVESSILLSAYLLYMKDVGAKEFNIGVMTNDEVKDLFQ